MNPLALGLAEVQAFLGILVRVSGTVAVAPVFGSRQTPAPVKVALSLILALLLLPVAPRSPGLERSAETLAGAVLSVAGEAFLGIALGFMGFLIFSAAQVAGGLLDFEMGFGITQALDPEFSQALPLVGNFQNLLALLVFLAINGHHQLLRALVASFRVVPLGGAGPQPAGLPGPAPSLTFLGAFVGLFAAAVQLAAPVLAALFLTNLALGLLARTVPQMNLFAIGLSAKSGLGVLALAVALPVVLAVLADVLSGLGPWLEELLRAFGR